MKPIRDMTVGELAAFVWSHLKNHDIEVVLSGGSCVTIYSNNKYVSMDLDFVEFYYTSRKDLKESLAEIGFHEHNKKYFRHPDTEIFLEFPPGPLSVGNEPVSHIKTLVFSTGELKIISPTDCVKDRLSAYYHWGDRQSLEQAVMVSQDHDVDLTEIERWSIAEDMHQAFDKIKHRFIEKKS